jgi:hypothetical protein
MNVSDDIAVAAVVVACVSVYLGGVYWPKKTLEESRRQSALERETTLRAARAQVHEDRRIELMNRIRDEISSTLRQFCAWLDRARIEMYASVNVYGSLGDDEEDGRIGEHVRKSLEQLRVELDAIDMDGTCELLIAYEDALRVGDMVAREARLMTIDVRSVPEAGWLLEMEVLTRSEFLAQLGKADEIKAYLSFTKELRTAIEAGRRGDVEGIESMHKAFRNGEWLKWDEEGEVWSLAQMLPGVSA